MKKFKTILIITVITFAIYACAKDDPNSSDANIIIPTWFSPDGDGINDTWKVQDPMNIINNEIFLAKIYDTAKNLVFLSPDKNLPWTGNKADSTVACDTGYYYYSVQYKTWGGLNRFRVGMVFLSRKP